MLPAPCADALLLYDKNYGMFDVSFAAAWELGRLLALKNKGMSLSLYRWKRMHSTQLRLAEQQEQHAHLPYHKDTDHAIDLPEEVENWFSALGLLKGLPFNYLVPDERMLPKESFRFFQLDPEWISCLIDGAFSVGRVTSGDAAHDKKLHQTYVNGQQPPVVSGFLLRSYVVKGWPKLQVDGYRQMASDELGMDANKLNILRIDHLSPNVLICLFEGDAVAVDIHQKPEMLHWGFEIPKTPDDYTKNLRNAGGKDADANNNPWTTETLTAPTQWDTASRVVQPGQLFNAVKSKASVLGFSGAFTSAQFALSMVEGVQKVRFVRK